MKTKLRKRKAKKLYDLDAVEVSFVDEPANRKKFLVMKKSHDVRKALMDRLKGVDAAKVHAAVRSVVKKAADAGSDTELSPEAQAALEAVARILAPFKDEITDEDLDALQLAIGMPDEGDGSVLTDEDIASETVAMSADDPEQEDDDAASEEQGDDQPDDDEDPEDTEDTLPVTKDAEPPPPPVPVGLTHGLPPKPPEMSDEDYAEAVKAAAAAFQGTLERKGFTVQKSAVTKRAAQAKGNGKLELVLKSQADLLAQNKALAEKVAGLESALAAEREAKEEQTLQTLAGELTHLGEPGELVKVLKSANASGNGDLALKVLREANQRVAGTHGGGGLYSELGSRLASSGDRAEDKIAALAKARVAQNAEGKTYAQIYRDIALSAEGRAIIRETKGGR